MVTGFIFFSCFLKGENDILFAQINSIDVWVLLCILMLLKLTTHFQIRMRERDVDFDHIKQAIKRPDTKEDVFEGRTKVQKKFRFKTIVVIYYREPFRIQEETLVLITAYYK